MSDIKLPELPTLYAWNTDGMVRELLYAYAREAVILNRKDTEALVEQCRNILAEYLDEDDGCEICTKARKLYHEIDQWKE